MAQADSGPRRPRIRTRGMQSIARGRRPPAAIQVLASALLLAATPTLGCSWQKGLWELGLGSFGADLFVVGVARRGDYLEATLARHGLAIRTYAPVSEDCGFVLQPEAMVSYVERGIGGRFEREGVRCDAVGIGDPQLQRARQPRGDTLSRSPVPRSQATFRRIYQDDEVILLHGRFPEAARIGWARADDCVAVVPNTPACQAAVADGVASMEYRAAGRDTLSLVSGRGPCRIVGLAIPRPR